MWKSTRVTCVHIFLLIMDMNGINGSNDIKVKDKNKVSKLSLIQRKGPNIEDISKLAYSEPGFDFTEQEIEKLKIWPGGIIPYYVDILSYDPESRKALDLYLEDVGNFVGVQFLKLLRPPEDEERRWVFFVNRRGVLNSNGHTTKDFTINGVQRVVLGYNSMHNGELFETTLAILGIPPQHNAPNRDKHISVKFNNIIPDKKHLFKVLEDDEWLFHDIDYDFNSAGHFGYHKYSVRGFATIMPKNMTQGIGNTEGFSYLDIWKGRMLYNFISKSESNIITKTNCNKMFLPGSNYKKYVPNKSLIHPRHKPKKYLAKREHSHDMDTTSSETNSVSDDFDKLKRPKASKTKKYTTKKPKTTKKSTSKTKKPKKEKTKPTTIKHEKTTKKKPEKTTKTVKTTTKTAKTTTKTPQTTLKTQDNTTKTQNTITKTRETTTKTQDTNTKTQDTTTKTQDTTTKTQDTNTKTQDTTTKTQDTTTKTTDITDKSTTSKEVKELDKSYGLKINPNFELNENFKHENSYNVVHKQSIEETVKKEKKESNKETAGTSDEENADETDEENADETDEENADETDEESSDDAAEDATDEPENK